MIEKFNELLPSNTLVLVKILTEEGDPQVEPGVVRHRFLSPRIVGINYAQGRAEIVCEVKYGVEGVDGGRLLGRERLIPYGVSPQTICVPVSTICLYNSLAKVNA